MSNKKKTVKKTSKKTASKRAPEPEAPSMPGYEDQDTDDLVGFWRPEKGVGCHMIPLGFNLMDSQLESEKPAVLFICKLLDRITVHTKEDEFEAYPGDTIGIWGKPGMRAMLTQGGKPTLLAIKGEKDTGKPKPMITFSVQSKGKGHKLECLQDFRRDSAESATWAIPSQKGRKPDDTAGEDIPFS